MKPHKPISLPPVSGALSIPILPEDFGEAPLSPGDLSYLPRKTPARPERRTEPPDPE